MKIIAPLLLVTLASFNASARDSTCSRLREFVESVQPDETRSIQFHTNWGGNFKDSTDPTPVLYAKRCEHHQYPLAKAVCGSLMEHGAVEFSGGNAKEALSCLSRGTTFADMLQLGAGEFEFSYGTDDRGSNVTIKFGEDPKLGGMVLDITAAGY